MAGLISVALPGGAPVGSGRSRLPVAAGLVQVRAHIRDGHPVAAHTRGAPGPDGGGAAGTGVAARSGGAARDPVRGVAAGPRGLVPNRRSLLDGTTFVPVVDRRSRDGILGQRGGVIGEGGGGGGGAPRSGSGNPAPVPPATTAPAISRRSQELVDIVAPGGRPIGVRHRDASPGIRTLPGGQPAAEAMFRRLTEGRISAEVTPRRYRGVLYRLDDGSVIGYRPITSTNGSPGIDINIPGFQGVVKIHF